MDMEVFDSLEKKIEELVEGYGKLKEEKRCLEEELMDLKERHKRLEEERDVIKAKVEQMLKRLEAISVDG